jgi:membrane protease YdiL (CAAX protease family)
MQDQTPVPPEHEPPSEGREPREQARPSQESAAPVPNVFPMAVTIEGGMGLLAVALGWLLGRPVAGTIRWDIADALWGAAATVPLLGMLLVCVYAPIDPLRGLLRTIDRSVVPLFRRWGLAEMAMVAALAGLGEEMLFRGVLQSTVAGWVAGPYGVWVGWGLASVVFGSVHAISATYAVLATAIGLYLGWLWIATGNLLVPVVAHGAYDFLALVYLVLVRGGRRTAGDG